MFDAVSGWWGASSARPAQTDQKPSEEEQQYVGDPKEKPILSDKSVENGSTSNASTETGQQSFYDPTALAYSTAKGLGGYFVRASQLAGKALVVTAESVKNTVEDKTIIGDFQREQERFVSEKKEAQSRSDAAIPPWMGYNEEEDMKAQILSLSQDKRNFLRSPPAGSDFTFDFSLSFPIAVATLQEDQNLEKMRFELVPKQIKEEDFWRNYFYRVSLIKQSAQLTSLAVAASQNSSAPGSRGSTRSSSRERVGGVGDRRGSEDAYHDQQEKAPSPLRASAGADSSHSQPDEDQAIDDSPPLHEHEFASDSFASDQSGINEDELRNKVRQLAVSSSTTITASVPSPPTSTSSASTNQNQAPSSISPASTDAITSGHEVGEGLGGVEGDLIDDESDMLQWERDIQKELQEFEVVNTNTDDSGMATDIAGGGAAGSAVADVDLENEILKEIEAEAAAAAAT